MMSSFATRHPTLPGIVPAEDLLGMLTVAGGTVSSWRFVLSAQPSVARRKESRWPRLVDSGRGAHSATFAGTLTRDDSRRRTKNPDSARKYGGESARAR